MKNIYVLDTSVLLDSPHAYLHLKDGDVVIPLVVITELEGKRNDATLGWQARTSLRGLEDLKRNAGESLRTGVALGEGGYTLRVEMNHVSSSGLPEALQREPNNDTRILSVAAALTLENRLDDDTRVVLLSKDLPLRLKAEMAGVHAESYGTDRLVKPYNGIVEVTVESDVIDSLYEDKTVMVPATVEQPINTGVVLKAGGSQSALSVVQEDGSLRLVPQNLNACGVSAKSMEQRFALNHLLNDHTKIVSLGGPAGTGKTMLALAAGLQKVIEERKYQRIIVFRDLHAVGGQDLGYLPGTEAEKMTPWAAAILDALRAFNEERVVQHVIETGMLEVLPLTHIRGRTLNNTFVLIDEAQNLEKMVLLTALSRLGENSKVVLSWDVSQRDNMRVGRFDGIASVVDRLKDNTLFSHTTLVKSERSRVAELVTKLMEDMV